MVLALAGVAALALALALAGVAASVVGAATQAGQVSASSVLLLTGAFVAMVAAADAA